MTQLAQTDLPSEFIFLKLSILGLITTIGFVLTLTYWDRVDYIRILVNYISRSLSDMKLRLEIFVDNGFMDPDIDPQQFYAYLTELIHSLQRLTRLLGLVINHLEMWGVNIKDWDVAYVRLHDLFQEVINLYDSLAVHLGHAPMIGF